MPEAETILLLKVKVQIMRKAKAERRGFDRGAQRKPLGSRRKQKNDDEDHNPVFDAPIRVAFVDTKSPHAVLTPVAQTCFQLTFALCSKLRLINLVQDPQTKKYKVGAFWRRTVHVLIWTVVGISMARNLWISIEQIRMGFDLTSLVCLGGFWGQLTGLGLGFGALVQPQKTAELLNTWSASLTHSNADGPMTNLAWSSLLVCLQVIVINTGTTLFPLMYPLFGLIWPSIPIFLLPSLQRADFFQGNDLVPRWAWWMLLYPLEVATFAATLLPFAFTGHFLLVEIGIVKGFTGKLRFENNSISLYQLTFVYSLAIIDMLECKISYTWLCFRRNMRENTLPERKDLQRLYIHGQIYHRQLSEWVRVAMVPIFFSTGGAITLLLYAPLKHRHTIPGYFSAACIYIAVILTANMVSGSLDIVKTTASSEQVIFTLQSKLASSTLRFVRMPEEGGHLKRSMALRSLTFPFGSFESFTLGVPIVFVEEILNQLLFLLTL